MDSKGWQSKDFITWMILIWGFYRLANPPVTALGGCDFGPLTQTYQAPLWAQQLGQRFTIEGEQ